MRSENFGPLAAAALLGLLLPAGCEQELSEADGPAAADSPSSSGSGRADQGQDNPGYRPETELTFGGRNSPEHAAAQMVLSNRAPDTADGFRGEVHPALDPAARLEVRAHWSPMQSKFLDQPGLPSLVEWVAELDAAEETRSVGSAEFSCFLPTAFAQVGQTWALDLEKLPAVLSQLHGKPRMHLVSHGRVIGQDGAYATLCGVSASHYDLRLRIHAEFELGKDFWYTPGSLSGRMVIDRAGRRVEYFRLENPDELLLNAHITLGQNVEHGYHYIVHTEAMELEGGAAAELGAIEWEEQIDVAEAEQTLALQYFKFLEIDFVPATECLARAEASGKPIFAIVLKGGLADQSC